MSELKNILLGLKTPYNIAKKKLSDTSMSFVFEPLAPGLGYTIGSALRRLMLSNTICPSIVAIKIPGIEHEFSSIPYTNIDLPALIAILKDLAIQGIFNGLASAQLICEAKAKDIYVKDLSSGDKITFCEQDRYLFTTSGTAEISITIWFACGYNTTLLNPEIQSALDALDYDTIRISDYYFRPVISVSCNVKEIMHSGLKMDSLELIVNTNGSVSCEHALYNALYNITSVFQIISDLSPTKSLIPQTSKGSIKIEDDLNVDLDQSLLPFVKNIAVQNFLESENILTVKSLIAKARSDIQYLVHRIPGGLKTLKNIAVQIKNIDSTLDLSIIEDLLG